MVDAKAVLVELGYLENLEFINQKLEFEIEHHTLFYDNTDMEFLPTMSEESQSIQNTDSIKYSVRGVLELSILVLMNTIKRLSSKVQKFCFGHSLAGMEARSGDLEQIDHPKIPDYIDYFERVEEKEGCHTSSWNT